MILKIIINACYWFLKPIYLKSMTQKHNFISQMLHNETNNKPEASKWSTFLSDVWLNYQFSFNPINGWQSISVLMCLFKLAEARDALSGRSLIKLKEKTTNNHLLVQDAWACCARVRGWFCNFFGHAGQKSCLLWQISMWLLLFCLRNLSKSIQRKFINALT